VRIYLDHNATAPMEPAAADALMRAINEVIGNASSVHYFGQLAKAGLDDARAAVAALIGADPAEVVFTSGGTESDNLALRGAAEEVPATGRRHVIVSAIEHEAVLNTVKAMARHGWRVTVLPVGASGVVASDALRDAIDDQTAIVSVMHANNELGTIQPVDELAAISHDHGALFHTDAVQSAGKLPLNARASGVDMLSLSSHKFGGPKGVGALWIRRGLSLRAVMTGGRQERGRRAGTENVPAIMAMGVAAAIARDRLPASSERIAVLRDRLEASILAGVPGSVVNGASRPRTPNTTNISFDRVEGEALVMALDMEGIAVSTGSACSSGTLEPSHVLRAIGLPPSRVQSAIRFSLGPQTTDAEIDRVCTTVSSVVARLRGISGRRSEG
jgi:cysteine desulfurase